MGGSDYHNAAWPWYTRLQSFPRHIIRYLRVVGPVRQVEIRQVCSLQVRSTKHTVAAQTHLDAYCRSMNINCDYEYCY